MKSNSQALPTPGFIPWSIPAAIFFGLGIVMAVLGLPWWLSLLSLGVLPFAWRPKGLNWLLLTALLLPLGFARYQLWEGRPNPITPLLGQTRTVSGFSDGRYLRLDEPKGVRVAISPRAAVPPGRVSLSGSFAQANGKRNPGGFDYQDYLTKRGVAGQFLVDEVLSSDTTKPSLKERLRLGAIAGLSERSAALMQAMTLGIRDDLGDLREIFAASGLAHILALSGLHVGILMAVLGVALRFLGLLRYPIMILLLFGFVLLVGASPSVLRAAAMVAAALLSLWLGSGRIEPWPALALAALITLSWNPSFLLDLSFQLSYLAVGGILLFTPPLMKRFFANSHQKLKWWHWRTLLIGSMVVSASAQALSLPLVASTFGNVPLLSPVVNIVAIPLASLLVPLGFLAALLGLVSTALAGLVNLFTGFFANMLLGLAQLGSSWPSLPWGEISVYGYAFYAIAMLALALSAWGYLRLWRSLLIVNVTLLSSMLTVAENQPPEIVFLDVGQGDSTLIRLPGRIEILIDGGGSPFSDFDVGAQTVVPALRALGVDELELVIASHPDTDHVEGLISVLKLMPVRRLVVGVPKPGDSVFDKLMAAAERNRVPVEAVLRGESLKLGNARLDILNPPREAYADDNDNSVAFVLNIDEVPKALLLGDISTEVEAELAFPDVDVLLAGHHGSRFSTSEALLRAAQPEQVVLSYGLNNYGHPNPDVVARIKSSGASLRETYREGAVRISLAR